MNLRIFASTFIRNLENLFNEEVAKIKEWCDLNKLSINMKKANWKRCEYDCAITSELANNRAPKALLVQTN